MKTIVCAARDSAMGGFAQPMFVPAVGVALRSFTSEVNRKAPDNILSQHPGDFELWVIAEYDDESGEFSPPEGGKRCLARGKDVVTPAA